MMAARLEEAERLRRCRQLFERAVALNCKLPDVRRIEAERRYATTLARFEHRGCADPSPAVPFGAGDSQPPELEERQLQWWQR